MKRGLVFVLFGIFLMLVLSLGVSAIEDCWDSTHSASQSACETHNECRWRTESDIDWCEQKNCYTFYDQTSCGQANDSSSSSFINKTCNWQSGSETGWCMEVNCGVFDGNQTGCSSNPQGLNCTWRSTECIGPPEKECWKYTATDTCTAAAGCSWGRCDMKSCNDYTSGTVCRAATGYSGQSCKWESQYSYCYESGCWDNTNQTACNAVSGCTWDGGSCFKQ